MISRLEFLSGKWKDPENRKRLNPIKGNFSSIHEDFDKANCIPDYYEGRNKMKPKFDIVLADFGYNIDQLESVQGLSYMGTIISRRKRRADRYAILQTDVQNASFRIS